MVARAAWNPCGYSMKTHGWPLSEMPAIGTTVPWLRIMLYMLKWEELSQLANSSPRACGPVKTRKYGNNTAEPSAAATRSRVSALPTDGRSEAAAALRFGDPMIHTASPAISPPRSSWPHPGKFVGRGIHHSKGTAPKYRQPRMTIRWDN